MSDGLVEDEFTNRPDDDELAFLHYEKLFRTPLENELRQLRKRLLAMVAALDRLALLVVGEFRLVAREGKQRPLRWRRLTRLVTASRPLRHGSSRAARAIQKAVPRARATNFRRFTRSGSRRSSSLRPTALSRSARASGRSQSRWRKRSSGR
jgi:hypothetical protein